ncbi:MAG: flagellar basal body rod protein FlgB [Rubrivivax sp.]|nr:flagellar basal body rod protein FlgB [Rubrivivax sp.]
MLNGLTNGLDFNAAALKLRAERQRLIASNIANADTPGYVARDFDFARALRDATGPASTAGIQDLKPSEGSSSAGFALLQRQLLYAKPSQTNLDRNTVDMDRERAAFAENAMKYEATLRFLNGQVRTTLDAMKSFNSP